jgi:prepilin-type processing-associated H-X9-DG protein
VRSSSGKFATSIARDTIFEMVTALAEDGSLPVALTGGFMSYHGPSCNFLFCDGSVRAVKESCDQRVYRLLGNRADGQPLNGDSY